MFLSQYAKHLNQNSKTPLCWNDLADAILILNSCHYGRYQIVFIPKSLEFTYPLFLSKSVLQCHWRISGKGNRSASIASEFNFGTDPESAYIVLHEVTCPIVIVSWELCVDYLYPWVNKNIIWTIGITVYTNEFILFS